jgi:hypothetical protein
MTDSDGVPLGTHLGLRKVRFVTYQPGDPIPVEVLVRYTREAAELAIMAREEPDPPQPWAVSGPGSPSVAAVARRGR